MQIICSLLIVNYHTNIFEIPKLEAIAKGGFLMNTVFVFLSGYMLTRSFAKKDSSTFSSFMRARARRIYPSFYITLTLILLYSLVSGKFVDTISYLLWYTGFGYFYPGNEVFADTHLWFVSVIMACYLLFIPTYKMIRRYKLLLPALLAIALILSIAIYVVPSKSYTVISNNIFFRFMYHYLVFAISIYWNLSNQKIEHLSVAKVAGFLIATAGYFYFVNSDHYPYLATGFAIVFSVLFIPIVYSSSRFFENHFKALFAFSPYTYELYLIHFPLIMVINEYMHGKTLAYVLTFLISIPFAVLIGKLSTGLMNRFAPTEKRALQNDIAKTGSAGQGRG